MLKNLVAHATLPAADLARARNFYETKLGLVPSEMPGGIVYSCHNSWFLLFPTPNAGNATHTKMGWQTDNLEQEVADLKSRGVVFEEYDTPGLKTVGGVATMGTNKAAWFKDTEGNILGLVQMGAA